MAQKPNLVGKIAGYFTYHKGDQSQRPLSMRNKNPLHKTNVVIGVASAVSFLLGFAMQGYWGQMLPIMGFVLGFCFTFAVLMQVAINKQNDWQWRIELMNKHKSSQLFG